MEIKIGIQLCIFFLLPAEDMLWSLKWAYRYIALLLFTNTRAWNQVESRHASSNILHLWRLFSYKCTAAVIALSCVPSFTNRRCENVRLSIGKYRENEGIAVSDCAVYRVSDNISYQPLLRFSAGIIHLFTVMIRPLYCSARQKKDNIVHSRRR